ncbi:hypothetical protein M404DRAFT_35090 [Pisolithus tinctorius Marx 270]|uniref:Integrase catalytic domain-containing protein n=1 Tax=Pisolithus tinctorius Marx 270 TaxID=870435 RepID=A0A0C3J9R1_PISTI|nr:hypothetical protein M404DRAFT_35090 [Pisolithus tinctorius Marx 270]
MTINHWIAGILLFSFNLVHVPMDRHASPDGLSRHLQSELDPPEDDDHEDWLDRFYSFSTQVVNDHPPPMSLSSQDHHSLLPPAYHQASLLLPASFYLAFAATANANNPSDTPDDPAIPRSTKAWACEYSSFFNLASHFFLLDGNLWHREPHRWHQLVINESKWYRLIKEAHDDLGHKGVFTVHTCLLLCFWWPLLVEDVKWYVCTCHECQICQTQKLHIPPTVPMIGGLFHKAHIDTMLMPKASGYCYIKIVPTFKDILCHGGPLTEIVTDNGPVFIQALDALAAQYHICHIHISPYSSQANGIVEHRHYDVCEAILKSCENNNCRWHTIAHSMFWAKQVTILKSTGLSTYFMVHSVELLFPFDLAEATFLLPLSCDDATPLTTTELIAWQVHQLQKCQDDLDQVCGNVFCTRFQSIQQFETAFQHHIKDHNFAPSTLVLVCNSRIEKELNQKMKPWYTGPMVVLHWTTGGSYLLAKLDGSISKLCFAAFCLLPYHLWSQTRATVTHITGLDDEELDHLLEEAEDDPTDDDVEAFASDS